MRPINIRAAKDYAVVSGQMHPSQVEGLDFIHAWLSSDKPYAILAGYAGTGKSYLIGGVVRLLQQVCWGPLGVTSPTHQARIELQKHLTLHGVNLRSEMITVATIHSWLGLKEVFDDDGKSLFVPQGINKSKYKDGCDVLIIDEASMIDSIIGGYVNEAWKSFRGKVLFVGDPAQIPPVGEQDSFPFLQFMEGNEQFYGVHFLREVVRQAKGSKIITLATDMRDSIENGDKLYKYPNLLDYVDNDQIKVLRCIRQEGCRSLYLSPESLENPRYVKALAYRNSTVEQLNTIVKSLRKGLPVNELERYYVGDTYILTEPLMDGEMIILPNNAEITIEGIEESMEGEGEYRYEVHKLMVSSELLETGSIVVLKPRPQDQRYHDLAKLLLEYAKTLRKGSLERSAAWKEYYGFTRQYVPLKMSFAITAHRSQGSTYTYTILDETDLFSNRNRYEGNRVAYTALTRAAQGVIVLR